jgi:hypothetical protein
LPGVHSVYVNCFLRGRRDVAVSVKIETAIAGAFFRIVMPKVKS